MNNNFYNHLLIEKQVFKKWIELNLFSLPKEKKDIFTILLPPPNITGKLHLGHALDGYIPDTLFRYKKLKNKNPYIIAGIDHAGISMQAKVEKWLLELKIDKKKLTNEEFLSYCYKWKEKNWNYIIDQWQTIGLSFDYENINFTLDKDHIDIVQDVFIKMYKDGLIYKAKKPVYWDAKMQTVISNIEVENIPTQSKMYYVKYNVLNSDEYIIIATTRPETIFSDVAIAIAKNHPKYKHLLDKKVINPLNKKIMPIIESDYVDLNYETGAMKVSAHAFDDFEIINKHKLEIIESIDKNGLMNENTFLKGLHYLEVRNNISSYLKDSLIKVKNIKSNVSISTRSYEPVEILVLDQWFVKMKDLASLVLKSLKNQEIIFYPKRFTKTLKTWMENVHDWNISRQLQWGHHIPIWYKDNQIIASKTLPSKGFIQDKNVLDTWFSSALCPFSFNCKIIDRPYPVDFLSTGYDIIFFWVARMYFQSLYYKKQIPFKQVFFHGIIRDENNLKMSKSLNNGIDPIDIIGKYGSDALRFFLLGNTTAGLDLRFNKEKLITSSRLVNKLWNIYQFIENIMVKNDLNQANEIDKWIINKIFYLEKEIDKLMELYNWVVICSKIYHFIFDVFSKWYVEFLKERPNYNYAKKAFLYLLRVINPFLPFISDYLFNKLTNDSIYVYKWNKLTCKETNINVIVDFITKLRKIREILNLKHSIALFYKTNKWDSDSYQSLFIKRLANGVFDLKIEGLKIKILNHTIIINLEKEEIVKLINYYQKELENIEKEIERSSSLLNNQNFIKKADPELVSKERENLKFLIQNKEQVIKVLKEYQN